MVRRKMTETEKLSRAKERARRKWIVHLAPVRDAVKRVHKVFTRSGEKVNARGSTVSQIKWEYWIEDGGMLFVSAEMDEPCVAFGNGAITCHTFEELIPLDMIDRGNVTELARFLRKRAQQLSK